MRYLDDPPCECSKCPDPDEVDQGETKLWKSILFLAIGFALAIGVFLTKP